MSRYQNGKIYKILNDVDENIYVGSTCQTRLCRRFAIHKNAFLNFMKGIGNMKLYHHMQNIGFDHFHIELIENYSCNSKDELHAREGYYIRTLKPSLNKVIPGRTQKQYVQDNREKINEYNRASHLRHIEDRRRHDKERVTIDLWCDCGSHITSRPSAYKHLKTKTHKLYEMFGGLHVIDL